MAEIREIKVRPEGPKVLVAINNDTFLELDWRKADELVKALTACARAAEAVEKAEVIAGDQAVLVRAGFPLALSADPRVRAEAEKLAAWDSTLRRYMPKGIASQERFGVPAVLLGRPKPVLN